MRAIKNIIRWVVRNTGLHWVIRGLFNLAVLVMILKGRLIGWLYGRSWTLLGQLYYDQRFNWVRGPRAWAWTERGMFAYFHVQPGAHLLDLCCGEGIFPALFLSQRCGSVDAIDRDPQAIAAARRRYARDRVTFHCADIIAAPFPGGDYDAVSCFVSLQYFSAAQLATLLQKIARALRDNGAFLGSVPLFPPDRDDRYASTNFHTPEQVVTTLKQAFGDVELFVSNATHVPQCYFRATRPLGR